MTEIAIVIVVMPIAGIGLLMWLGNNARKRSRNGYVDALMASEPAFWGADRHYRRGYDLGVKHRSEWKR